MWRLACARYEALSIDPLDIGIPQGHVLEVWRGGLLHSELGTTMDGLAGEAKKLSETIDELTKKLDGRCACNLRYAGTHDSV